jgi:hypothetical protein
MHSLLFLTSLAAHQPRLPRSMSWVRVSLCRLSSRRATGPLPAPTPPPSCQTRPGEAIAVMWERTQAFGKPRRIRTSH